MDRYKRLASNTIILALGQFGSKFLVILMMRFYQNQLGQDGYGVVCNIVDAAVLLMAFATFSIGESIIRFGLDKSYDKNQVFSIGIKTTTIGLIFALAFIPLSNLLYSLSPESEMLRLLSENAWMIYFYVLTGSVKSCCGLYVRSIGYVRLYAIDGILTTIVNIGLNLLFLLAFNLGVFGYVLSIVLADAVSIVFLSFMADLPRRFVLLGVDKQLRRAMLRFAVPMIPTTIMWWVTSASDTFFVTEMVGVGASGFYKAAYRLPNIIALISGIFSQAWNMSAITEKNSRTIARFYTNVFNIFQSFVFVLAAGMIFLMRPAMYFLCAEDFQMAYIYTPFIVLSVVFTCFSTFMGSVYVAAKMSMRSMVTACVGAVLNIMLNFLLIPIFQLHGAAIATFISYLVIFIVRAYDSRKIVFMDLKLPKLCTNGVLLFIMGMITIFVTDEAIYFISLAVLFVMVVILNFKSLIDAVMVMLKKRKSSDREE